MATTTEVHPLEPLSGEEIAAAAAAVREQAGLSEGIRYSCVELSEPTKEELEAGEELPRIAQLVVLDNADGRGREVTVDLGSGTVTAIHVIEGMQPAITGDEYYEAGEAAKANPAYRAALARRGISDPELVMVDSWSMGQFEDPGRRLIRGLAWLRADTEGDNGYARPIGGLVAVVDLNTMEVVRVDDHGPLPVPDGDGDYRNGGGHGFRDDVRPIEITQPEGPSFTLDGRHLHWQRWDMRVGWSAREGLVLHQIGYTEHGERRPVCHRASIAELVIPYGDPNPTVHFKNAFDIGEYGIGPYVNSLELGCDCLGEIRYLDAWVSDSRGRPAAIRNAICIHEEDVGILWKHHDDRSGRTDVARARRLVVSCIATVGNYEYGFFWYFGQDGSIEFEGKLTGIVHTAGIEPGSAQSHATEVTPGVAASHHQHFFCARLDMDVDGTANTVVEVDARSDPPGPGNPDGTAFHAARTVLEREGMAARDADQMRARRWRVESGGRRNRMGGVTAYELVPGDTVAPMADPGSEFRRRSRFLDHQLWVTPYVPSERYPAGEYPNQHEGGDGLPRWTARDRELEGRDVVLWYVFGAHHVPRLEDWPVMPVVRCGFQLRPVGFFDRNPGLDVPPPARHCDH